MEQRKTSLGRLGEVAHTQLQRVYGSYINGVHLDSVRLLPLEQQWTLVSVTALKDPISAVYMSLLLCEIPCQVLIEECLMRTVLGEVFYDAAQLVRRSRKRPTHKHSITAEGRVHVFPVKTGHPGALRNTNVWLCDVVADLKREAPTFLKWADDILRHLPDDVILYNDQVAGALIHHVPMYNSHYGQDWWALYALIDPGAAKIATSVIKTLGWACTRFGAWTCELHTLRGRGVEPVSWSDDLLYRLDPKKIGDHVVAVDQKQLADAVRTILDIELGGREIIFADPDSFWSQRWLWCVNGAHSRYVEQQDARFGVDIPGEVEQVHRKVYVECLKRNPMYGWRPVSYYSASEKLEHGKTRAIYSCDSLTYINFTHLLGPVEHAWRNRRVVLDPGLGGNTEMVNRVKQMCRKAGIRVMLDYEDFNSQHSLASMVTVIRTVCEYVNYEPEFANRLCDSLLNGYVVKGGQLKGKVAGTLMSGHRATSFLNSILNMAYLLLAFPPLLNLDSMHVGDDVIITTDRYTDATGLLRGAMALGLRMAPLKQSVGRVCAEFLRMNITESQANGYLARAVSSAVSGNWVSEKKLSPGDALQTFVQLSWTLRNRCFGYDLGRVLTSALKRFITGVSDIPDHLLRGIISHRVSLNGGPVYGRMVMVDTVRLVRSTVEKDNSIEHFSSYATDAYLSNHTSEVEREALYMLRASPKELMVDTSYAKSVTAIREKQQLAHLTYDLHYDDIFSINKRLESYKDTAGVLNKYPLIHLYRNQLTDEELKILLAVVGVNVPAAAAREVAFNERHSGAVVLTPHIYADVHSITKSIRSAVLDSHYYYNV